MKNLSLPIRFGVVIGVVLIAYFLVLSLIELHVNPVFSLFNVVITGFGIYETIYYTKLLEGDKFSYTNGFSTGLVSGFVGTIIFSVFFLVYITEFDSVFLSEILSKYDAGFKASIGLVTFLVALLGVATTLVLTFSCMQYLKNSSLQSSK